MAFYFSQGNFSERIDNDVQNSQRPRDQLSLSLATDDNNRNSNHSTNGKRREKISETLRMSKQGSSRRENRLAKLFGEQVVGGSGASGRARAEHWRDQKTTLDLLGDTNEVLFNSEGRVIYGTWHGLIAYLTQVHRPSDTYTQAFFLTFRSFATPADLADALVARVRELSQMRMPILESRLRIERSKAMVRHNVFLVIKQWYEEYWWPHADDQTLPFLCSYMINEYLPECRGTEAKDCHRLLLRISSKNASINLRSLANSSVYKSVNSVRKLANNEARRVESESAHYSRPYIGKTEVTASHHSSTQRRSRDLHATISRDAAEFDSPLNDVQTHNSSQLQLESAEHHNNHHRHHRHHRSFWHRLFSSKHRNNGRHNRSNSIIDSQDSDSGSSLFASPQASNLEAEDVQQCVGSAEIQHDAFSVAFDSPEDPKANAKKRRYMLRKHENTQRRSNRDSGVRLTWSTGTSQSNDEPDISDLLMATVGMDLSLEAYRSISHIYQVSPVDVACQLTIIESSCYCQIEPYELINKEFSRGSDSHAINVRQMSRWCTQITRWASAMILLEPTPERRCRMLRYFIDLGIQLLALKNYDAVMAIKAAIYSAAVMRLKRTWSVLPKKYTILCRRLHEAMDSDRNYANYRNMLRRSQPPLLPFLGLYLTDLTFLDDGNPTYRRFEEPDELVKSASCQQNQQQSTESTDSSPPHSVKLTGQTCALFAHRENIDLNSRSILINFEKSYRLTAVIQEMQKFQVEYSGNFTMAIPGLQQYLIEQWEKCEQEGYDDDKIYSMSLKCEPRAAAPYSDQIGDIRAPPTGMRFSRLLPGSSQRQRVKEMSLSSLSDSANDN
ncbi:Ras guanine nucleotide exchange factor bud5 [Coemansia brasiliensis]|uniref:Ras guanine nucleotide exchange factor bud5 n=1 Tax=Coemansia brasiliensis TaxID=2650707 RepID=A0A9W8IJA5_9FUNG|nr:Ras guanine nucleotide exchange factor bud5 [Coemansia brasiliensis]